jgi:site-specific DNA recombinase
MGGRIPYGYRVEGKEEAARLVPDETPLGLADNPALTPADVVRLIYQLTANERQSGAQIAARLNALGVPTAFALRGLTHFRRGDVNKPALHTWKADSVTNILGNSTYKGERVFGKRPRHPGRNGSGHDVVTYPVPALVTPAAWEAAQAVMASHQFWNARNDQAAHDYLLRGMLRCAHCGLLYVGDGVRYVCTGRRRAARLWGDTLADAHRCHGRRCPRAA